jgi:hypothetical protein
MKETLVIYDWQNCPGEGDIICFNDYAIVIKE